jgi:tetratricopeptide (TPR) repeat protein
MQLTMRRAPFHFTLSLAALVVAGGLAAPPLARGSANEKLSLWPLWSNETFVRQFLGSYGVQAEVEPRVTTVEKTELEKVAALMAQKGGLEKAHAYLSALVKPADTAVYDFTLGSICFQQEQLNAAAQWYAKAVAKFPSFLRAHKNLGVVRVRLGDYQKAVESLTLSIELGAKDGVTFGLLGFAFLMIDEATSAETAYREAIMLQPSVSDWKMGLARCLFKQRKYEEAAALCGELIAQQPDRSELWLLQANAFLGMKETAKAAENYEYLDLKGQATPQSLNALGDIYVSEGLIEMAADTYLRAIEKDADPAPTRILQKVEILVARGAYTSAERLSRRLKALPAEQFSADERKRHLKLDARIAAAQGPANPDAARILDEIVQLDPLDGEALILLGQHHASAGNLEKAAFLFERAQGISQHEAEASLRHAQCLVRAGKYQQAVPLLKRTQELRPREDVARYLEQVERVARSRN